MTVDGMAWIVAPGDVRDGLTGITRRRGRPAASRGRLLDRPHAGHEPRSSPRSCGTGLRDGRGAAARPADFPGAPPESLVPGSLVFTPHRGPSTCGTSTSGGRGRRALLAAGRRGRAARSTRPRADRSSTSPARTPRRTPRGPGGRCRPRPSGSWRRAAVSTARPTSGATSRRRPASGCANCWHGDFPWRPKRATARSAPVGSFPPNGSACPTWRATSGSGRRTGTRRRRTTRHACCVRESAAARARERRPGPAAVPVPRKVVKGGSFLCADSCCLRYRPAARRPQMIDTGMSHIGFRCVCAEAVPGVRARARV